MNDVVSQVAQLVEVALGSRRRLLLRGSRWEGGLRKAEGLRCEGRGRDEVLGRRLGSGLRDWRSWKGTGGKGSAGGPGEANDGRKSVRWRGDVHLAVADRVRRTCEWSQRERGRKEVGVVPALAGALPPPW